MNDWYGTYGYYASIAALLLAGDIKATVVENPDHRFLKVWLVSGGFFMWSEGEVVEYGPNVWVYSHITPEGEMKVGMEPVPTEDVFAHASVEEIAKMIATFDYEEALDFPEEHPADLDLTLTSG